MNREQEERCPCCHQKFGKSMSQTDYADAIASMVGAENAGSMYYKKWFEEVYRAIKLKQSK